MIAITAVSDVLAWTAIPCYVDVREAAERTEPMHADVWLPFSSIRVFALRTLDNVGRDSRLVCYCRSGRRALLAALFLRTAGYAKASAICGGPALIEEIMAQQRVWDSK